MSLGNASALMAVDRGERRGAHHAIAEPLNDPCGGSAVIRLVADGKLCQEIGQRRRVEQGVHHATAIGHESANAIRNLVWQSVLSKRGLHYRERWKSPASVLARSNATC